MTKKMVKHTHCDVCGTKTKWNREVLLDSRGAADYWVCEGCGQTKITKKYEGR